MTDRGPEPKVEADKPRAGIPNADDIRKAAADVRKLGVMADFAYWKCPVCGYEDSGEYVVDPDLDKRIEVHKDVHKRELRRADNPNGPARERGET